MPTETEKAVSLVRLRIADTHQEPGKRLFADADLEVLLGEAGGDTYRAAADALRIIAASENLVSKKIRTQDLSTDGPAVARELRAQADTYDAKADEREAAADGGSFHLVPFGGPGSRLETVEHRSSFRGVL